MSILDIVRLHLTCTLSGELWIDNCIPWNFLGGDSVKFMICINGMLKLSEEN